MKPFEERYTAWVDGRLTGAERDAFEQELPDRGLAEADRTQAQGLGNLLRQHRELPSLANADFFSQQLLERMGADLPALARAKKRWSLFSLPNMAWATACCALLVTAFYFVQMAPHWARGLASLPTEPGQPSLPITAAQVAPTPAGASSVYDASILETTAVEPGVSASVYSQGENITVLWLDGLDYLPASYILQ